LWAIAATTRVLKSKLTPGNKIKTSVKDDELVFQKK
jgi:hypothetical protein